MSHPAEGTTPNSQVDTSARNPSVAMTWVRLLASAAVYATFIVTFVFQVARVDGQSMAPTLADNDRVVVNKLAYQVGEPRIGDVVMLYHPMEPDKMLVKRIVGQEGDRVRISNGVVYRNDRPTADDYVPAAFRGHDDWGPETIAQGCYFVLGDHRNSSSDSRHFGCVPKKYILGKVQVRWWPFDSADLF